MDRKMGGYLAVQQGSAFDPVFIHLVYKPPTGSGSDSDANKCSNKVKKIVLIGKL